MLACQTLSPATLAMVEKAFDSFDIDRSKAIDIEEAIRHWSKKKNSFSKLSAQEFFKAVDMDGNGEIEYDEFLRFWQVVKKAGYKDQEIHDELERIKDGETWVGFSNLPVEHQTKPTLHNRRPSAARNDADKIAAAAQEAQ